MRKATTHADKQSPQFQANDTTQKFAYSIREVESAVGISHSTAYQLIGSGELKTFQIGRRRLVSADALREFIQAREAQGV
jgi:excisionase family DNA binding protein